MPLATGSRLGPYEILSLLGAGGMGEVYLARDTRLGRDVAVKILPSSFAGEADRLRRFEQEARAVAALNHPNILAVHDIGNENGSPYLVSELLEGSTLRERIKGGALPSRKAIEYALQVARGLAVAHEKGVVHRDLKPDNLFITKDGRVKILDFGLAKLTRIEPLSGSGSQTFAQTENTGTSPGVVMGTIGYLSPELVRGQPADHRSDIFSFGAILYEMLSGERAFKHDSAAETMTAILKEDPPDLAKLNPKVSPGLERIVRHCLEKNPEERFQSARDLAFDLESLSDLSASSLATAASVPKRRNRFLGLVLIIAAAVVLLGIGYFAGRQGEQKPPLYHQLTFRRGTIRMARFAPDGQTVVYGAAWEGNPIEIFASRPESPESRLLGLARTEILAISSTGEMAVTLAPRLSGPYTSIGTLARLPLAGGAPREMLEEVQWADWSPDGTNLAVVRNVGGLNRLEFPIGKVLYETNGWISHPRISPQGDRIAFLDHPLPGDDGGLVSVVDLEGHKQALSVGQISTQGLAWSANGKEIWFTATRQGSARAVFAISLTGHERLVARMPGTLTLQDIYKDGRVLLARDSWRRELKGLPAGETKERDLSWLDYSYPAALSRDGKTLLFDEEGEGGGWTYAVYLRKTDGSPAIRLGPGQAMALSPDEKWVISLPSSSSGQFVLLPTKAGEAKPLTNESINHIWACWFPDSKRFLFSGNAPSQGVRLFVQDMAGGKPQGITPEGINSSAFTLSPDGQLVAGIGPDQKGYLYPVAGGEPRPISGLEPGEEPISWGADGRSLFIYRPGDLPAKVYRLELGIGRRTLLEQLMPSDPAGVNHIGPIVLTPDGKTYVYGYHRTLTDLYLVEGLK